MQPTPLGRYLLTERFALGGTAEIFKAKLIGIEGFEKTVVIKRILPHWSANPHFVSMLIDEAKIMVRLNHERIVQVYELGKEEETYYIVMEYVAGTDLRKFSERVKKLGEPISPAESLFILGELLRGLDYIHKQKDEKSRNLSIVHRDISPQNILISDEGAIKIADFGIAHAASRSYETATGVLKGKFAYMSPEQARGSLLDQRTDLFAAGVILFELLTGRRLFAGGSDLEVLDRVKNFDGSEIDRDPRIEKRLKPILKKALNPQLKERYSNAHDFWKDLQEAMKALEYHCDAEEIAQRLKNIMGAEVAPPEKKGFGLHLGKNDLVPLAAPRASQGASIVSSGLLPGSVTEETRTLSEVPWEISDRKSKFSFLRHWPLWAGVLGLTAILLGVFYFRPLHEGETSTPRLEIVSSPGPLEEKIPPDETAQALKAPETQRNEVPSPEVTAPPITEAVKKKEEGLQKEKKAQEEKRKKEERLKSEREKLLAMKKAEEGKSAASEKAKAVIPELPPPTKSGQGNLSVRASPWGKISISGVVNGSERPVSKNVSYGNYTVSVSYQNISGEWKTLSRAVRVAKAVTVCTAAFRPDGQGSISCN